MSKQQYPRNANPNTYAKCIVRDAAVHGTIGETLGKPKNEYEPFHRGEIVEVTRFVSPHTMAIWDSACGHELYVSTVDFEVVTSRSSEPQSVGEVAEKELKKMEEEGGVLPFPPFGQNGQNDR